MELFEQIHPGKIHYIYVDEALRETDLRRGKGPFSRN